MNDWLDKFRDDRPKRPGGERREERPERPGRPERRERPERVEPSGREDDPRWLDRFSDDGNRPPRPKGPPPQQPGGPQGPQGRPPQGQREPGRPRPPQQPSPQSSQPPRPRPAPQAAPQMPGGPGRRPQDVAIFAGLMALSLALGLTATALAYPYMAPEVSALQILLPDLLALAVVGAFVFLVWGMRQFWAVWILLAFCAVRFLLYVPTFFHIDSVAIKLLTSFYFILQGAAFWFVFTPVSRNWFGKPRRK